MTDDRTGVSDDIGVLICDDVAQVRALLNAIVDTRPRLHVVGEAATGQQAISQASRLQPDVILLDLSMPGMTGFEALPHLKRVAPRARVIVLSGFSADLFAADVLAQGAHSYLEKGASPEAIANEIEAQGSAGLDQLRSGDGAKRLPRAGA